MNNGVAVRVYSRVISKKASHMNIQLTRIAHLEQVSTVWDVRLSIVEHGTCDSACQLWGQLADRESGVNLLVMAKKEHAFFAECPPGRLVA